MHEVHIVVRSILSTLYNLASLCTETITPPNICSPTTGYLFMWCAWTQGHDSFLCVSMFNKVDFHLSGKKTPNSSDSFHWNDVPAFSDLEFPDIRQTECLASLNCDPENHEVQTLPRRENLWTVSGNWTVTVVFFACRWFEFTSLKSKTLWKWHFRFDCYSWCVETVSLSTNKNTVVCFSSICVCLCRPFKKKNQIHLKCCSFF